MDHARVAVSGLQAHHGHYKVLGSSPLQLNEFGLGITTFLIVYRQLVCLVLGLFLLSLPSMFLFFS
eukprot:scaffold649853_cov50-Prasinocladus_malaysianus.AAC.1